MEIPDGTSEGPSSDLLLGKKSRANRKPHIHIRTGKAEITLHNYLDLDSDITYEN